MGIPAGEEDFFTSAQAAVRLLQTRYPGALVYCQGTRSLVEELRQAGVRVTTEAEPVDLVLTGFDLELTSEKLRRTCQILTEQKDVPYYATNPDLVCPVSFGYVPDCGSMSIMLRNATGREPIFIGKPEPTMIQIVMEKFGCTPMVIPAWQGRLGFYSLFFIGTMINALLPDYLYRGLEKMSAITIRTVCIRAFSTLGIFLFLKKPEDIWVIPVLTAIGNFVAVFVCFYDARKRLKVRFCPVSFPEIWLRMKQSSVFFLSRFATTAYSALNVIILDLVEPKQIPGAGGMIDNPVRGYYAASDKLMDTGKQALQPISDSLYPYMVKHHDYRLVKKVLLILEPIIFVFCTVMFLIAPQFCELFFGEGYAPAGKVLRVMLPTAVVLLPSYICGFPMLSSMGLAKHANYSTVFGSVIHLINLAILYFTGNMNMITLGAAMSVAEILILCYRLAVIWRHRDLLRKGE